MTIWLDPAGSHVSESAQTLARILDLIRSGTATTRPELASVSGFGRTVVTQRVQQLLAAGLVAEGDLGVSTGGRAPRRLELVPDAGLLLVAELGATSISVGIATLQGELTTFRREPSDIAAGPEIVLTRVEELFDDLLDEAHVPLERVWGVGIGIPGPVEFATGRPTAPPIMPGWDGYPIRERLAERYVAPVWVDNDVNLMALGELRRGVAMGESDMIFLKVGSGIGAGLVSEGRLHRGARGSAGDVGHIEMERDSQMLCRCGNYGCLEALAGGKALTAAAERLAREQSGSFLGDRLETAGRLEFADVHIAARHGDPAAGGLLASSASLVGLMLATLVNFHNPSMVVVGGQVAESTDGYLASVRQAVLRRSLPLATRDLRIVTSSLRERAGLLGAAFLVIDELFSPGILARWIDRGAPAGHDVSLVGAAS
jgi:glucokinase-like ROK family protein